MAESARTLTSLFLPLLLAGAPSSGCSRTARIEIAGQEARLSPALVDTCSVFMRIANSGDGADALVRASVDLPGAVAEIHETRDGRMVRSERLAVPARGSLELRPGGPHIMVFHLPRDTGPGRELALRLQFETSGERSMSVKISE